MLQDEFEAHEPQLEQLEAAAQAINDKQDSRGRAALPIQSQVEELRSQWDALKGQLDDREGKIDDVLRESEHFHDTLQDSSDWLIDFRNKISTLAPISNNPDVVKQQMEETKVSNKFDLALFKKMYKTKILHQTLYFMCTLFYFNRVIFLSYLLRSYLLNLSNLVLLTGAT